MFNYPVEKNSLRFYKYKFLGFEDKPVIIEAYNKLQARQKLMYMKQTHPELENIPVISESLSLPIFGETTKMINGVKMVWVGNMVLGNWMSLEEFMKMNL